MTDTASTKARPVKYPLRRNLFKYRFDFDIGMLLKSPCRECVKRKQLPRCADQCTTLDRIHEVLSHSISCAKPC